MMRFLVGLVLLALVGCMAVDEPRGYGCAADVDLQACCDRMAAMDLEHEPFDAAVDRWVQAMQGDACLCVVHCPGGRW